VSNHEANPGDPISMICKAMDEIDLQRKNAMSESFWARDTMWRAMFGCDEPACHEMAEERHPDGNKYCAAHRPIGGRIITRVMDDGINTKDGVG
jgi:hypothetical protein